MRFISIIRIFLFAPLTFCLSGCFFPESGPSSVDFQAEAASSVPYALIPLTPDIADVLSHYEPRGLAGVFPDRRPPSAIRYGVGDKLSVTIFEAAAGGLFIPSEAGIRPGNFVQFPADQLVDNDGNITVPYAGAVKAAGRTNVEIQNDIIERIKNRAIEPQAIVALSTQNTNLVSVIGEVNLPLRFPMPYPGAGDRVLDAIARAGGIKGQGFETWVILERGKRRATVPFENLIMNASNNVYIQPGDRIYVYREQQKFIAFGAFNGPSGGQAQGEFNFDAWRISLAEAVAKAGGILDVQGDPASVFLYRREPRDVVEKLGVDVTRFPDGDTIPVIFSVSFQDPGGYFLATKVLMRNQDVIFVADARSIEISKFLQYLDLNLTTANNATLGTSFGVFSRFNLAHPGRPLAP